MFGYVRPLRGEMKCADFDRYRAYYCGLCRAMRRRCGPISALALNYDFAFLAILLSETPHTQVERCRCPVPPFRRKCVCAGSSALDIAADESVILTYWQLCDRIRDAGFLRRAGARCTRLFFAPAYRRAARRNSAFDTSVREQLDQLHRMEEEKCPQIDPPADAFARLLCAAAPRTGNPQVDRPTEQLLYHLGRWIYLIDARDDLSEDAESGNYNPLALRYSTQERDEALGRTLDQSIYLMRTAASLLELGDRAALVENVITFGLPNVQRAVFHGKWKKQSRSGEKMYE